MKSYCSVNPKTRKPSNIIGYDYDANSITVYFSKNSIVYVFTNSSCGDHVEKMKHLADSQSGLQRYIDANKPPHSSKFNRT